MGHLHRWRRPRRYSYVALVGALCAAVSVVGALWDGRGDAWLPGKMTWAGASYAGVTDQTRVVIGVALLACLLAAVIDPANGLLAATCVLSAQRIWQNWTTEAPSLLVIVLWGGLAVLASRDTNRIRRITNAGGSP